eukprot:scaffold20006_cov64-Phaeocystis_antarctica.AAC.1
MAVILRVVAWSLPKTSRATASVLPRMSSASSRDPVARSRSARLPIESSVNWCRSPSVSLSPCSAS